MSTQAPDLRCPVCSFPIYNRLVANCEKCGLELPETLVHPRGERDALKRQYAAEDLERMQVEQERRAAETKRDDERRRGGGDTPIIV